jgi:DNA-binding MarR family transcriptional regulator
VSDQPNAQQQTAEVAECFFELIGNIIGQAEQMAHRFSIPAPFIKALHTLDCPMAMKELGKRMHCDPSFVTVIADGLEKPADRRVKNIVLTGDGEQLKAEVEAEMTARMPWNQALTEDERTQLLALLRKMLSAGDLAATEVAQAALRGPLADLLSSALRESEPPVTTSPPSTGEVNSPVSSAAAAS